MSPPIIGEFGHHIKRRRGQRWGNNFNDDEVVDDRMKDGKFVEIKATERGRANDHDIDDHHPPSHEDQ